MSEIHRQRLEIDRRAREALKQQRARCFWFTGLPASGKSTIANLLDRRLHSAGRHSYVLDGDNIRLGLSRDLDFTHSARAENIRRVAEVARLMVDAGLIVIAAFISPFRAERAFARSLFEADRFVEVFIDAPLAVCEGRDPKGLYAKARSGALHNFTGYDSPYELPEHPDIRIDTTQCAASEAAERLALIAQPWCRET
jgi:bifunctional enzyme CysN/CysC